MKTMLFRHFIMALPIIGLAACSSDDGPEQQKNPEIVDVQETEPTEDAAFYKIGLSPSEAGIQAAANDFALDFFRQTKASAAESNVVVSPLSTFQTLALLSNGDNGEIRDEIVNRLGFSSMNPDALNSYAKTLNDGFAKLDGKTRYRCANSIWVKGNDNLQEGFAKTASDFYLADINSFENMSEGIDSINSWVEKKTSRLIKDFLGKDSHFDGAIVNALYFKGGWQIPFEKEKTAKATFLNINGSSSNTDFMNSHDMFEYVKTEKIEAVGLSLGNGNFRLDLIRPADPKDYAQFIQSLDGSTTAELTRNMMLSHLDLSIPKFEVSTKANGRDILYGMGFEKTVTSEFENILDNGKLTVNNYIHAARLNVNEEGIEGASASAVSWIGSNGETPEYQTVEFNSPFIYILEEVTTGAILFIGEITSF